MKLDKAFLDRIERELNTAVLCDMLDELGYRNQAMKGHLYPLEEGYKLVGVNPHSANVGVAMMLADYITNEENQLKRFNDRNLGPSNINVNASDEVQAAPAIAALAAQSDFADLQRVGANYWDPAASLGQILASGDTQGKTTQQLVDDAVAGITAPVAQ